MFSSPDEKAGRSKLSDYAPTSIKPQIPMPISWGQTPSTTHLRETANQAAATQQAPTQPDTESFAWSPPSPRPSSPLPETGQHRPQQRSAEAPPTSTRPLIITGALPAGGNTTRRLTRPLTYIPAPDQVARKTRKLESAPAPRKRSRAFLISGIGLAVMLLLTLFVSTPLGGENTPLLQGLSQFLLTDAQNAPAVSQHIATPTPTPALTTLEGSCNAPSMGLWGICATAVTDSGVMGTGEMQPPMKGETITQPFGSPEYQTWCVCVKPHTGIDLAATAGYGAPVLAADSGQVIWVGWDWSGLGNAVKINHGRYIATVYGHLASYIVQVGQNVKKGDVIAYEGSTGASSGPHVHFMVVENNYFKDPANYVKLP